MNTRDDTTEARLWARVNKNGPIVRAGLGPCWVWTGYVDRMGYGQIGRTRPRRLEYTHRVAWEALRGPIPDGLCALHKCDNPACCNPEHLFLGDRTENMCDKTRKGRQSRGERGANAKLTAEQVREMTRLRASGARMVELAARFGVCRRLVRDLVTGRRWAHLLQEPEHAANVATARTIDDRGKRLVRRAA